MSLNQWKSD